MEGALKELFQIIWRDIIASGALGRALEKAVVFLERDLWASLEHTPVGYWLIKSIQAYGWDVLRTAALAALVFVVVLVILRVWRNEVKGEERRVAETTQMIIKCSQCGQTNRVPLVTRGEAMCGSCGTFLVSLQP